MASTVPKVQVSLKIRYFAICIRLRGHCSASAGPSPQLVQSLLSLSDSTSRLGFARHPARQKAVVQDTLRLLITSWIDEGWEVYDNQALHDLAFLRKIADVYGSEWEDISILLADKLLANVRFVYLFILLTLKLTIFHRAPTPQIMRILIIVHLNAWHGVKRCSQDYSLHCRRRLRNLNCYSLVCHPLLRLTTLLLT